MDSMIETRVGWDRYFLDIAIAVSKRADCRRRAVGCLIVSEDHRILSSGYNGVRAGKPGCLSGACPRGLLSYDEIQAFSDYSDPNSPGYCVSSHAETNAIIHAGRLVAGSTIYVTDAPCPACLKMIKNAGINWLVFEDEIAVYKEQLF